MRNITQLLTTEYIPFKSIIIYESKENNNAHYIESYDFGEDGQMVNAHPLSGQEMTSIGKIMLENDTQASRCLQPKGFVDTTLLHFKSGESGFAIWYSPPQHRELLFVKDIGLTSGVYPIPSLLWKASKEALFIYALKGTDRPTLKSVLYKAPFFNIYNTGNVCMGSVEVDLEEDYDLETLMRKWEQYFFQSRFSHLLEKEAPVKGNIIQLYTNLQGSGMKFPESRLLKHTSTIKDLLHG